MILPDTTLPVDDLLDVEEKELEARAQEDRIKEYAGSLELDSQEFASAQKRSEWREEGR